jgi:hypothetical protein
MNETTNQDSQATHAPSAGTDISQCPWWISLLVLGLASRYAKEREDTAISALWSVGMAVGVLFIAATPGRIASCGSCHSGDVFVASAVKGETVPDDVFSGLTARASWPMSQLSSGKRNSQR